MSPSVESNFAGRLLRRLGAGSHLTDAATGTKISAGEISALTVGMAAGFLSAGLQPGDAVLIRCSLTPFSTLAYLGAMYAGLVPIPIDDRVFQSSGKSLFLKTRARAVWTENESQCAWAAEAGAKYLSGLFPTLPARPQDSLAPAPRARDDLAALMPTSGSTGTPRLVQVTHGNLIANTEAIIHSQSLGTEECAMLILPLSYCFGASVVHT